MNSDMSMRTIAFSSSNRKFGERLGQLGLADAGGAEEHERADRPVRVLQAGAGAAHGLGDGLHRLALADDALGDLVFHAQQLVALAFQHLVDRNAGPARHDLRDVVGVTVSSTMALARPASRLDQLLLEVRDLAIGKLARLLELALALRDGELVARLVELLLLRRREPELLLLGLPFARSGRRLLLEPGQVPSRAAPAGPSTRRPSRPSAPRARS
jgi:hypothetical protein